MPNLCVCVRVCLYWLFSPNFCPYFPFRLFFLLIWLGMHKSRLLRARISECVLIEMNEFVKFDGKVLTQPVKLLGSKSRRCTILLNDARCLFFISFIRNISNCVIFEENMYSTEDVTWSTCFHWGKHLQHTTQYTSVYSIPRIPIKFMWRKERSL